MLKDDWFSMIEQGVKFPDGHFDMLLLEGDNLANPLPLFRHFHGGLKYCERLKALTEDRKFQGQYLVGRAESRLSEVAMRSLVDKHLEMLVAVATEKRKLDKVKNLQSANVRFESDWEKFDAILNGGEDSPPSGLRDTLDDYYISKIFRKDSRLSLVDDATLNLTMSRSITMWLMEPLVQTGLNFRSSYDIAIGSGLIAVLRDEVVCHIQDI